jgi:hypothetical protein
VLSKNALVILPFVVGVWFVGATVGRQAPFWAQLAFFIAVGIGMLCVFLFLIADTGWRRLSRTYRASGPFDGQWRICNAGHISRVSIRDHDFIKNRTRLSALLRVGASDDALHLRTPFSRVPLFKLFLPQLEVPWSAIRLARVYTASGWASSSAALQSAARRRAAYDPSYTGEFVELVIGDGPVFMQMPLELLGVGIERLAIAAEASEKVAAR